MDFDLDDEIIERVCFVLVMPKRAKIALGQGWSQQEHGGLLGER